HTAPPDLSALSLHDALPISLARGGIFQALEELGSAAVVGPGRDECGKAVAPRGVSVSVRSDVDALSARSFNLGDGFRHASRPGPDRKSTRLNSSHLVISYAV